PAQAAKARPLQPDDARRAADALKRGDPAEAARRQEKAARDLERLADDLDRARELARDPREAARQLARMQDGLRQRGPGESPRRGDDRPMAERLRALRDEQAAVKRAAEGLSVPSQNAIVNLEKKAAQEEAARAADLLGKGEPREALGAMEQARRSLER